jgi:hypothetical protein
MLDEQFELLTPKDELMTLSLEHRLKAIAIAKRQFDQHQAWGTPHRYNRKEPDTLDERIAAVGAEIYAGVQLRTDWEHWVDSAGPNPAGDIGPGLQVRYTHRDNGHLPLHDDEKDKKGDDPKHVFFLVTGKFPRYVLRGWCYGWEGKTEENWERGKRLCQEGRICYLVPQCLLNSIADWFVMNGYEP